MTHDAFVRLERLERRTRRQSAVITALLFTVAAGLCAAAWQGAPKAPEVIRARGVVIVDEQGRERILIGAPVPESEQRTATIRDTGIVILDTDGKDRLALGENKAVKIGEKTYERGRAFNLLLFDKKGDERGGFGTFDAGKAVIALDRARPGMDGVALMIDDNLDFAGLVVTHHKLKGRYVQAIGLGVQGGEAFLNFDSPQNRRRLNVVLPKEGDPACQIIDAKGTGSRDVFAPR